MANNSITRGVALVAIPSALALGACGMIAEEAVERGTEELIERESGGDVDIDLDDGGVSVDTEDGSIDINGDGDGSIDIESEDGSFSSESTDELPDDFPDLPLPSGFSVMQVTEASSEQGMSFNVAGTVDGGAQDVFEDLRADYESAGFEEGYTASDSSNSFYGQASFTDSDWNVNLIVSEDDDDTSLIMTVSPA